MPALLLNIRPFIILIYNVSIKFREYPEGLGEGKKSENLNPASMCKSRPVGTNSTGESVRI